MAHQYAPWNTVRPLVFLSSVEFLHILAKQKAQFNKLFQPICSMKLGLYILCIQQYFHDSKINTKTLVSNDMQTITY